MPVTASASQDAKGAPGSGAPMPARVRGPTLFGLTMALPAFVYQLLLFATPLVFMVLMTFWLVVNFRPTPDVSLANWEKLLSAGYFWDIYLRTFLYGVLAAAIASLMAFPCAFLLAFKAKPNIR